LPAMGCASSPCSMAKAGQLAGANQTAKVAGKVSAMLPGLLAQPIAGSSLLLMRGEMAGDFAANLGATQELQAKLAFTNLEADPKRTAEKLPVISVDVRADVAAAGQITIYAPLLI